MVRRTLPIPRAPVMIMAASSSSAIRQMTSPGLPEAVLSTPDSWKKDDKLLMTPFALMFFLPHFPLD